MKQNRIRLTESQLHRVIKESVKKTLEEGWFGFGKQKQQSGYDTYVKNSRSIHNGDSHYAHIARIADILEEMKKLADEYTNASNTKDWAKQSQYAQLLLEHYGTLMREVESGWKLAKMFASREAAYGSNTQQNFNVQR